MPLSIPLLIAAILAMPAHAQQAKAIDRNLDNISGQYAECAAYFRLVYHALVASNDAATASKYRKAEDDSMLYSLLAASEGRDKDLAVRVTNSRIEMYLKSMKNEVNNRNENISILINKHGTECIALVNTPPAEIERVVKERKDETKQKRR